MKMIMTILCLALAGCGGGGGGGSDAGGKNVPTMPAPGTPPNTPPEQTHYIQCQDPANPRPIPYGDPIPPTCPVN